MCHPEISKQKYQRQLSSTPTPQKMHSPHQDHPQISLCSPSQHCSPADVENQSFRVFLSHVLIYSQGHFMHPLVKRRNPEFRHLPYRFFYIILAHQWGAISMIVYNQQSSHSRMQDKTIQVLNSSCSPALEQLEERGSCSQDGSEDQRRLMNFKEEDASTRLQRLALAGLPTKPHYKLHSSILLHTPITENMRAKLRTFLMAEASKQCLLRETCTLACTLVDLYFLHQGQVVVSEFQNLVLGCLILAAKLREAKLPTISYNIFNREQLLAYERKVARKLSYFLQPHTYHSHAERIVFLWDQHTRMEGRYTRKLGECPQGVNFKLRRFYEQLDCVYMVLRSLDYDCEELVLNLFYLHVRMINIIDPTNPVLLNQQQFLAAYYPNHDTFLDFYLGFLKFYSEREYTLDTKLGNYLKLFLGVSTAQREWTIKGNPKVLEPMRIWDKLQSYPKDNYALAKRVIERVKVAEEFKMN